MSTYPVPFGSSSRTPFGDPNSGRPNALPNGFVLFSEGSSPRRLCCPGWARQAFDWFGGRQVSNPRVGGSRTRTRPPGINLGFAHAVTAQVVKSAKLSFLSRDDLIRTSARDGGGSLRRCGNGKSVIYYSAVAEATTIAHLSQSAEQKMARFLLGIVPRPENSKPQAQIMLEANQKRLAK